MNMDFPYRFDRTGGTAGASADDHVRDLIEQVLFTVPGERVNRPGFGSGLLQLVFAPNSDPLAAATQLSVQASLQQWLGGAIEMESVIVENDDSQLKVTVRYRSRKTQQSRTEEFVRAL